MSDRTVLMLVDAGFFWKALLLHMGKSKRNELVVDYESLCEVLSGLAEEETGARLLRQTWYDAGRGKRPTAEHRALSSLAGVHVRLGWFVDTSNGPVQKAVDTAIVRDMVVAAQRGSTDEIVLIAGDGDLVPGVAEAVDSGIKINLWGLSVADPRVRQSDELVALADRRLTIDIADIQAHVRVHDAATETIELGEIDGASSGDEIRQPVLGLADAEPLQAQPEQEVPADMGDTSMVLDLPASPPGVDARLGPPPLSRLAETASLDGWLATDSNEPMSPKSYGARYGSRWTAIADTSMHSRLHDAAQPPRLPRLLDSDLLKLAGDLGLDTLNQGVRHGLRAGFWDGISTPTAVDM